jgi:protein-L-isoaspartate O-methyltransferase
MLQQQRPLRALLATHLRVHLKPGHSVLDATCGSGAGTVELAGLVTISGRVTALDRSPQRLHDAAKHVASRLDKSFLPRITMVPLDAFGDHCPGAPFDAIAVAVVLPGVSSPQVANLVRQLKLGGRLVAPVALTARTPGPFLMAFDKGADGALLAQVLQGPVQASGLLPGVEVEGESAAEREARERRRADKLRVQRELEQWRAGFEAANGRRPSRQELADDPVAGPLFGIFTKS